MTYAEVQGLFDNISILGNEDWKAFVALAIEFELLCTEKQIHVDSPIAEEFVYIYIDVSLPQVVIILSRSNGRTVMARQTGPRARSGNLPMIRPI